MSYISPTSDNILSDKRTLEIRMPKISWGACKTKMHKGTVVCDLANGYCMLCWDNGCGVLRPHFSYKKRKTQKGKEK